MNKQLCLFAGLACFVAAVTAGSSEEEEGGQMELDVTSHYSCGGAGGKWEQKLVFPDESKQKIVRDPNNKGCYMLGGDFRVTDRRLLDQDMYVHVEMYQGEHNEEMDECYDYDKSTHCGGFGGACLYCDMCTKNRKADKKQAETKIWMTYNGQEIECGKGFRLAYDNQRRAERLGDQKAERYNRGLQMHFCMPTEEQFLRTRDITKSLWDKLTKNKKTRREGGIPDKISLNMYVRYFNFDVRPYLRIQRNTLKLWELSHHGDPMPMSQRQRMKFNEIIWDVAGGRKTLAFIGCHRIEGNVYLE
jgi:hypothetical protein